MVDLEKVRTFSFVLTLAIVGRCASWGTRRGHTSPESAILPCAIIIKCNNSCKHVCQYLNYAYRTITSTYGCALLPQLFFVVVVSGVCAVCVCVCVCVCVFVWCVCVCVCAFSALSTEVFSV